VHRNIKIQVLKYSYQKINNLEDILSIMSKCVQIKYNTLYNIL